MDSTIAAVSLDSMLESAGHWAIDCNHRPTSAPYSMDSAIASLAVPAATASHSVLDFVPSLTAVERLLHCSMDRQVTFDCGSVD